MFRTSCLVSAAAKAKMAVAKRAYAYWHAGAKILSPGLGSRIG